MIVRWERDACMVPRAEERVGVQMLRFHMSRDSPFETRG